MNRGFSVFFWLLLILLFVSCRSKKETAGYNYHPVFDQTRKAYVRTPDRSLAQLDTSVLIRSNLKSEIVNLYDTIQFSTVMAFIEAELLADLEQINEKPIKYDSNLVLRDYLYRREWVDGQFPERVDSIFIVTDPFAYGSDPTERFRDRDIFNKPFLSQREIMMFQNRDFSKADSLFAEASLSAPYAIGDQIPYQESINLLYYDGNLCLLFDTILTPYREPIKQLSPQQLYSSKKNYSVFDEAFYYYDQIEFLRYYPEQPDIYIDMVRVQGGDFKMGSDEFDEDERPATMLSVSSFLIGKYEVTNRLFCYYLNDLRDINGLLVQPDGTLDGVKLIEFDGKYTKIAFLKDSLKFKPLEGFENHPVVNVTWYGAQGFARFAVPDDEKKRNPNAGRIPSEAEWEYAARGGVFAHKELINHDHSDFQYLYRFSGGNDLGELAYFVDNSYGYCQPIGAMRPNELGIYDLCGNVWEWCYDRYDPNFLRSVGRSRDPMSLTGSLNHRVVKGGSWSSDAMYCRITNRNSSPMESSNPYMGFRLWKKW